MVEQFCDIIWTSFLSRWLIWITFWLYTTKWSQRTSILLRNMLALWEISPKPFAFSKVNETYCHFGVITQTRIKTIFVDPSAKVLAEFHLRQAYSFCVAQDIRRSYMANTEWFLEGLNCCYRLLGYGWFTQTRSRIEHCRYAPHFWILRSAVYRLNVRKNAVW